MSTIAERLKIAREQDLLTVEQFALLTQYHPRSVYRLITKGALAIVRIGPRTIRIPRSAARTIRPPQVDDPVIRVG
jgi:excisionase family DNA binding protein